MAKQVTLGTRVTDKMAKEFEAACEYWAFKKKLEREEDGVIKTSNGLRKAIEWFCKFSTLEIERDEAFQTFILRRKENQIKRKHKKKQEIEEEDSSIEIEDGDEEEEIDDKSEIIPEPDYSGCQEGDAYDTA